MDNHLVCWKCGAALGDEPLPLSRRAECRSCRAELHACRMCRDYDPNVSDGCREDRAEAVTDKAAANFCDYFEPRPDAFTGEDDGEARAAKAGLEALFGGGGPASGQETGADRGRAEQDHARRRLEDLFGGKED